MNPSLRSPVDPLACRECGMKWYTEDLARRCCAADPFAPPEPLEGLDLPMTEQERDELLLGGAELTGASAPEEAYLGAVHDLMEAREAVNAEELRRAEIELVAIEELVTNGQARSQTAAKEMKTLHPDYRKHKERLNALELAVTRAEAIVEVRKAQMWREVYGIAVEG